jgi:choline-sulfatase
VTRFRCRPRLAPARGVLLGVALALGLAPAPVAARKPKPSSVVLIIVDTLRADRMSAWGCEREVMPRLDEWMERAVVFEQARAPSPWTLPSFASIYTGLYPPRHGAGVRDPLVRPLAFVPLRPDVPVLAELLRQKGLATGAFVANRFLRPKFGVDRGFTDYSLSWEVGQPAHRADVLVDSALAWLDHREDGKFFLLLHVFDPHEPYDPPPETRGRFSSGYHGPWTVPIHAAADFRAGKAKADSADRAFIADVYDEDTAFADLQLGRFLDELQARGILDRSLVVFTADHGEEFWDHGGFEHGHTMYDELLHVPLAVWAPGVKPRHVATPVTLADVMPTILDAVGARVPSDLDGVSLWPAIARKRTPPARPLIAGSILHGVEMRAVIDWPWKLVETPGRNRFELYDLADDPGETADRASGQPDVVERLAAELARRFAASGSNAADVELDPETLETLRALGYVD